MIRELIREALRHPGRSAAEAVAFLFVLVAWLALSVVAFVALGGPVG